MTDREVVRRALYDAIDWQVSLGQAYKSADPERLEAFAQVKRYRAVLKRRYGVDSRASDRLDTGELVTLEELRLRAKAEAQK